MSESGVHEYRQMRQCGFCREWFSPSEYFVEIDYMRMCKSCAVPRMILHINNLENQLIKIENKLQGKKRGWFK